ncbi:phosphoribosyltransferase [Alicycliphilus denitrificans]|mgnify:CR=1 FL=1|uniref:Phosphoribosyltransferase n=1 Tax=Alicycliphilus denitrificans TaxID=179636 RepID=A0A858ZXN1_9BURK|nr:phosphoribosyltransferase family protein [Alicycliphilus denitrificans]QKD45705.1 phosphoribosyltransferase [Alicycliphilus denitrificans]
MHPSAGARSCLYDRAELDAVMHAMAGRVAAWLQPQQRLAVIGILRRGAPLAQRLTELLVQRHGIAPPLRLDLSVKRYADDLTLLYPETRLDEPAGHAAPDLGGHSLLVVDDVLYSGHSLLRVLQYLAGKQPQQIRVATLVDRCVARLPVHADVVGVRLEAAPGSIIDCHVPPYEPDFQIDLVQPGRAP